MSIRRIGYCGGEFYWKPKRLWVPSLIYWGWWYIEVNPKHSS